MATITYTRITEVCGDEEYGNEFEYEVDGKDLRNALAHCLYNEYFSKIIKPNECGFTSFIKALESLIDDNDLTDSLFDYYYDEVKDLFADDAEEWYESQGGGV